MKNLSNVMTNAHWFAMWFTSFTEEMGKVQFASDKFGEMLLSLACARFAKTNKEFNRENAKDFIREVADGYLHYGFYKEALDELYKAFAFKISFMENCKEIS